MNKFSVLIVDDNETDRYLIKRYLKKLDFIDLVFEADDGKTALEFFANSEKHGVPQSGTPPTLVFLDVNMPIIGGFDFLKQFSEMRGQHGYETIVFMMLTSSGLAEEKAKALSYSFVKDYLTKGQVDLEYLKNKIAEHCSVNPSS